MHAILLTFILLLSPMATAQTVTSNSKLANILAQERQQRADLVKVQDRLLEQILQIPFEKRVYIYPALFEEDLIPKKVLTHPQIVIWKGKKPTRIAPQMKEFAEKNLDTMAAKFYPMLDPDAWPTPQKESEWRDLQQMMPNVWQTTGINTNSSTLGKNN